MNNRLIKLILFFGILGLTAIVAKEIVIYQKIKPLCPNCNILLISIDTLAAKHLQCYGYERETAPNLCKFAKDNILFSNSYSQSHWTRPSQTSVLTGLHVTSHGVIDPYTDKLLPKFQTIQKILKENGYKTYYYGPKIDNDSWDDSVIKDFDVNIEDYTTDGVAKWNEALDMLKQNKKNHQPTFMYLHTYYVHDPYLFKEKNNFKYIKNEDIEKNSFLPITDNEYTKITPEFENYVTSQIKERINGGGTKESIDRLNKILSDLEQTNDLTQMINFNDRLPPIERYSLLLDWYFVNLKKSDPQYLTAIYDDMLLKMDTDLKTFFDRVSREFSKDTIVVIYGDHGQTLGERGSVGHCSSYPYCLYNETIRVPLIFKIPGIKNKTVDNISQGIDIYPTLLEAIGKEVPEYVEGESLTDLITGKTNNRKNEFVVSEEGEVQKAFVDKKWKLYFKETNDVRTETMELYDLENDMWEKNNVINNHPEIVADKIKQLKLFQENKSKLNRYKEKFPDWIDDKKREKLIREGYF